ncbi:type three secretion system effector protein, partial [Aeromonas diversa CDC 2478-85]
MQIQQASRLATTAQTDTVSTPVHDQQERAPTLASSQGKGAVLPLTQVSQPPVAQSSKGDVICATCGPRQVEITRHQDGSASVTMQHPPLTSLVLSGGGAKGAAYPGAI